MMWVVVLRVRGINGVAERWWGPTGAEIGAANLVGAVKNAGRRELYTSIGRENVNGAGQGSDLYPIFFTFNYDHQAIKSHLVFNHNCCLFRTDPPFITHQDSDPDRNWIKKQVPSYTAASSFYISLKNKWGNFLFRVSWM